MKALLLSAYDATSHRRWREGLVATFPEIDWTLLTLPPRHFKWRTRGNALWWAFEERATLEADYDVVLATSTVDLAALVGLVPALGEARLVTYFHENQFAYPTRKTRTDVNLLIRDAYCAAATDKILFNSEYNRRTFFDGLTELARTLPDYWPRSLATELAERTFVVPVGLDSRWFQPREAPVEGPLSIVWNHRWEFDKGPSRLFRALELLIEDGVDFRIAVLGETFRQVPEAFARGRELLGDRVTTWGWIEDLSEYRLALRSADVVVSTALHEFQGLSMLEATASGCHPVAPNRLTYPEYFPQWCLYDGSADDPELDARRLAEHLTHLSQRLDEIRTAGAVDVEALKWSALRERYLGAFTG